ncbi:MAG: Hpt domain-containing protein, partial [Planctomycetota bacterium]
MSELDDVVSDFLVESYEGLDQLDSDLLALEKDPSDSSLIASIFRTIHTIKGTCGFLGFEKLERVSHVGENLLSKLRDGERAWTSEIADVLLKLVDATRAMLTEIENNGAEGSEEYAELVDVLTRLQQGDVDAASSLAPSGESELSAGEVMAEAATDEAPAAEAEAEEAQGDVAAAQGEESGAAGEPSEPSAQDD